MKVSVCVNTSCEGFDIIAYPELHVFEYLMKSLREQSFKDFEVIIADVNYEKRKNYFNYEEPFPVKHVPVKDNLWTPRGLIGIASTKNTCLQYAKGEVVVFTDDCSMLPPLYLEKVLEKIAPKHAITNTYNIMAGEQVKFKDLRVAGPNVSTYGNTSMILEDYLELNGYNELFDGAKGLEDCDLGLRFNVMGGTIELIDYPAIYQEHSKYSLLLKTTLVKCARLTDMMMRERYNKGLYRANEIPLTDEEFRFLFSCSEIQQGYICPYVGHPCKSFINATGQALSGANKELMELYRDSRLLFDLREQRKNI